MASPISIFQVVENFCFNIWGFDNDYIILNNTNTNDTDNTNKKEICECLLCYTCQFISKLSDTCIKHKSH